MRILFILLNFQIQQCTSIQIKQPYSIQNPQNTQLQMTDKSKLIQSMTNLIHHVSSSRRNQQQIFATLSSTDIRKILNNLDDSNQKLRKTTLMLLAELLYDNSTIQNKFCQLASLPMIPGKVVFSSTFPKSIIYDPQALAEVLKILKDNSNQKQSGIFWYIDIQTKPRVLQYGKRNFLNVDPLFCIVGGWLKATQKNERKQQRLKPSSPAVISLRPSLHTPVGNDQKSKSNSNSKIIWSTNGKVRLNRSQHIEIQKEKQKQRQRQIVNQFKLQQLKSAGKSSTGEQQMTQSTKLRDNNYMSPTVNLALDYEKIKNQPITIRSQIKNISKTDYSYRPAATERKQYNIIQAGTNGYQNIKYIHQVSYQPIGNQFPNNQIDLKYSNLNKSYQNGYSNYRIPQTATNKSEIGRKIDTMIASTTTNRNSLGQDIRSLAQHSKIQNRR